MITGTGLIEATGFIVKDKTMVEMKLKGIWFRLNYSESRILI